MRSGKTFLTTVLLFLFIAAGMGTAHATTSFGLSASKTKIGDAGGPGTVALSRVGNHGMVAYGTAVYAAYTVVNYTTNETEVFVGKSYDGGLTWSGSELVAHGANIDGNGAVAAVGTYQGTKYVHVAWGVDLAPSGYGAIYYSRAADTGSDGWSWSAPVPVIGNSGSAGPDVIADSGNISTDDSGRVHVTGTFYDTTDYSAAILYARSADAGQSFQQETAVPGAASFASMTSTSAGDVFLSWQGYKGDNSVFFSKRTNSGWTSPVSVSGYYQPATSSIAAMGSTHIYIAWGGTFPFQGSGPIYFSSSSNGGTTWTPEQIYSGSPVYVGSAFDAVLSLGVSSAGVPSLVFSGVDVLNTPASIYFMRSSKSGWSAPVKIQTDGRSPSIAINSSGKACVMTSNNAGHAAYFTREQ